MSLIPGSSHSRRPSPLALGSLVVAFLMVALAPAIGTSAPPEGGRAATPEDRYAMAGGCYGVRSVAADKFLTRKGDGFAADAGDVLGGEPFHFQATDLGSYLLFGSKENFLAVSEGTVGAVLKTATKSTPGADIGGVAHEKTDAIAATIGGGPLGVASGRGSAVVAAAIADELADWEIQQLAANVFTIHLPATGQFLASEASGTVFLSPGSDTSASDQRTWFGFALTSGCAHFPEIEVNVDGPVAHGASSFEEVRGFLDAHVHMMAFEFIGGRVRCGRPWSRFGVVQALVDCPDHQPGGRGAVLEDVLSGATPGTGHDTVGWPTFGYWPRYNSLTHEQLYYKWLERAWRGGLRMMTNLLVDNHALCTVYPLKKNSCNEMDGVRLQAQRLHELERYIDAQNGGPGKGWFRIVKSPFEARRVINSGKLALVMGIEVSLVLDCGEVLDFAKCNTEQIDKRLDDVYDLGVRQMELANKFDNALTGVTGDNGTTGIVVNGGNKIETGRFWQMEMCTDADGVAHDHQQLNLHDDANTPDALTGRDSIFAGVLEVSGTSGVAPLYPPGPQCNIRGLTPLGEHMIRRMISKGMIFDPDHMSARARQQGLDILEKAGYSGVVSSHSWADDAVYPRVYELGGVVTPYAGGSTGFVNDWHKYKTQWADPRYYFGFGYGSDVNGFGAQGAPRGADAPDKVTYPFTGFGGTTVYQQHSGERVYDINTDGVAHYGMYPDWLEDLRKQAGDEIIADMTRGPEAYLQMWERAIGIPPNACRTDIPDLTDAAIGALHAGMTVEQVLGSVGQPETRAGTTFSYCMTGGRTATANFTADEHLVDVTIA
jgi:hypothetical protein